MLTIDANVFVSANSSAELQHSASVAFFSRALQKLTVVYCPSLVMPETAAAMVRSTNNVTLARRVASSVGQLPGLAFVSLTERRAVQASEITIRYRLRGADAVYVAVAQEFGTTLITWDAEMLTRGAQAVAVMTPSDWLAANPTI